VPASGAIESIPAVQALAQSPALFAAVETVHTLGIVALVGSVFFLDLRILGLARQLSVRGLARLLLPWSWAGLVVMVLSGVALFAVSAQWLVESRTFQLKMALLATAAANAGYFLTGPYARAKAWDVDTPAPFGAKLSAILSLFLWSAIIACGRWLAYS
jgi:hypothetical protein